MGAASIEELKALTAYAQKIGLAFQIVDDILDITGEDAVLGKKTGSDVNKQKMTYPALYGLEKAQQKADTLLAGALCDIETFGEAANNLRQLADKLVNRKS